jgi:hypothetical protein
MVTMHCRSTVNGVVIITGLYTEVTIAGFEASDDAKHRRRRLMFCSSKHQTMREGATAPPLSSWRCFGSTAPTWKLTPLPPADAHLEVGEGNLQRILKEIP